MTRLQKLYRELRRRNINKFDARELAPKVLAAAERIDAKYEDVPIQIKDRAMKVAITKAIRS